MQPALDFLRAAQSNQIEVGDRVVVIGAGNVGCDVATEAHRMGARDITLIDIQEPASFGKERREAERAGATFKWPVFVQEVNVEGVLLTSGELLPADTVVVAVGEEPDTGFLPQSVKTERGFVSVNENYQTTDPNIFAIGDAVKPGLITDAIGAGRRVAQVIDDILQGKRPRGDRRAMIDRSRIRLEYFDPRYTNLRKLPGLRHLYPYLPHHGHFQGGARGRGLRNGGQPGALHRVRLLRRGLPLRHLGYGGERGAGLIRRSPADRFHPGKPGDAGPSFSSGNKRDRPYDTLLLLPR
jgi:glycine/D-amino acid oxidase-like deaminating enzyme